MVRYLPDQNMINFFKNRDVVETYLLNQITFCEEMFSRRLLRCCIFFLVQPGRSPGTEMCLSAPGIYNKDNNHV